MPEMKGQMIGLLGIRNLGDPCSPGQDIEERFLVVKHLAQSIFMTHEMTLLTTSLNRLFHQSPDLIIWILLL